MLTDAIRLLLFPAAMVFAASSDLFTMTISNRVTVALIAGFAVLAVGSGMSAGVLLSHVGAGVAVLALTFSFFALGWIGGGDAKLAAATALWFGLNHMIAYLLYAAIFGGILTLLIVGFRFMSLPEILAKQKWIKRLHHVNGGIPYGIALAAAALLIYPETGWMKFN